jgi:hypothetical protein
MPAYHIVSEFDVLVATARFLWYSGGVYPYKISLARGQGIDPDSARKVIEDEFNPEDVYPIFVGEGPDIKGISSSEWWLIECKGVGKGVANTQRNNFDRALSSAVSYYEDKIPKEDKEELYQLGFGTPRGMQICLGLALPRSPHYLSQPRRRVRKPLRKKLNLWVLLYDPVSKAVEAISPTSDYPYT